MQDVEIIEAPGPGELDKITQIAENGVVSNPAYAAALGVTLDTWALWATLPAVREAMLIGRGKLELFVCSKVMAKAVAGEEWALKQVSAAAAPGLSKNPELPFEDEPRNEISASQAARLSDEEALRYIQRRGGFRALLDETRTLDV